jgi:DNA/RNA-binding domain of Phe-tRNA-synthetase-like protein
MIKVTEDWRRALAGAHLGVLAMTGVANPQCQPLLQKRKEEVEAELRLRYGDFDKAAFRQLAVIQAYEAYYRRWGKSYHVLAQVESVAVKGKAIPAVASLVEAMFMAELKNMLLTAGHDLERLSLPLTLDVAAGGESYLGIRGSEEVTKAGDMMIYDAQGIISSIIHGPDSRTRINPDTTKALFTVYAPAGITEDAISGHLRDIEAYVRLVAPAAVVTEMAVL